MEGVASDMNMRFINSSGAGIGWKSIIYTLKNERKSQQTTTIASMKSWRNNLLDGDRKAKILSHLVNMPVEDKWRLMRGRCVKDAFVETIKDSSFEHPCLSYILDLADPI